MSHFALDEFKDRIKQDEIDKYLDHGKDFIKEDEINACLKKNFEPDAHQVKDILKKSLSIKTLSVEETACLLNVNDPDLLLEMKKTALEVKQKVYDHRIVTFAPLYLGNFCVNKCLYCGFKSDNTDISRRVLSMEEIKKEVEALAGAIGHKRLVVVYGEHPKNDIDYIIESIKTIYGVSVPTKHGVGNIRRVNVNAPPFSIKDLIKLRDVGLGTYQVFQETYHHDTYRKVHPSQTIKGNYAWRLYCMHRALEAGIDDVGIGVLFGLYDWKFEVLGLLVHAIELEKKFGVGPHTISFPRLEPAHNVELDQFARYHVSDEDFKKVIMILRLSVPHVGLIVTARESEQMRREVLELGITQTDASSRIGVGAYDAPGEKQRTEKQQFILGDTRSLDEVIREFAKRGQIPSFCTAGYRCGRTGKCIMDLLRDGTEGKFCKLNAILTFREWLDDFASEETKKVAEPVLAKEIEEVKQNMPKLYPKLMEYYERIKLGERDLYL
ncbi:MAG: [FeFe] hydrogenase H-cluster radical SAM maturase HydG [Oscillospiraceae bacterium]|jgi:2-iminoacetate synthase